MSRFRCLLVAAALAGATGCGATQQETIVPVPREDVVRVPTGDATADVRIQRDDFITRSEVTATRAQVWDALAAVMTEVGLPQPVMDRSRWMAVVDQYALARTLAGQPLSKYLSCGSGMSGEHADTRRIRLTVRTGVESVTAERTAIMTRVEATAHSIDGTSTAPAECSSKGLLESEIVRRLRSRFAGSPDR